MVGDLYCLEALRNRTEMLEEELATAKQKIYDLEHAAAITERALMQKAKRKFTNSNICLTAKRVHRWEEDQPVAVESEYRLQVDCLSPISLCGTDLRTVAEQIE